MNFEKKKVLRHIQSPLRIRIPLELNIFLLKMLPSALRIGFQAANAYFPAPRGLAASYDEQRNHEKSHTNHIFAYHTNRVFSKGHKSIRRSFEKDRKHCINVLNASSSPFNCKTSESHPARRLEGSADFHFHSYPSISEENRTWSE